MDAAGSPDARVLARLDDGEALLAERSVDKGRVLMLATSAHVGWTNLPLRPIFLPLVVRLTFWLSGGEQARREVLAGSPLVLELDGALQPVRSAWRCNRRRARSSVWRPRATGGSTRQTFSYPDTHQIGIYQLRPLGAAGAGPIALSVNVDPDEAEEKTIDRDELEAAFRPHAARVRRQPGRSQRHVRLAPRGREPLGTASRRGPGGSGLRDLRVEPAGHGECHCRLARQWRG